MSDTRGLRRREFIKVATGAAAVSLGGRPARRARGAAADERPNILLIISDEHNASVTGCYENRIVRTPNLDALAAGGVTFSSAYCNSPLCVPSRLSLTSGKYIHRVGAWSNNSWLPGDDTPSIARVLSRAGYEPLLCGKMHYDATRRYGFRLVEQIGNSSFKTGTGRRRKADDLEPQPGLSGRFRQFHPGSDSGILSHDRRVTAGVSKFLNARKKSDKPFFLIAGYLAPHFPLIVAQKYWDMYKGKVPMPKIPPGHLESQVRNWKHLRTGFNMEDVPDDIVRKGRELYYGLTTWFDKQVGTILDVMKRRGLADNTVVIYTTDHGENIGEHGLWWKNCMYEHAARVPLIINWPKRWKGGQRRTGACSLVDLVQTVAELAGGRTPGDWDGESLCAWMDDAGTKWKDRAVSQYYAHNICSGYAMLRSGKYKYIYHTKPDGRHDVERELYDLAADPGEFTNLAARAEHRQLIEGMEGDLFKELGEHPQETEARCRADYAKGYGRKKSGKGKKK